MKTADFLRQHDACREGAQWALSISASMADVWDALVEQKKYAWLLWTLSQPGVFPESILRKLACRFVRETPLLDGRKVWDLLTDERSRRAIEVAEAYADGKATKKELVAAAYAAYDAALAAADDAAALAAARVASAAAHASDHADHAVQAAYAADAAYAAARAADAADADDAADAAARAAAYAADAAYAAARAADAADAAEAAQARMVSELGNPFKKEAGK